MSNLPPDDRKDQSSSQLSQNINEPPTTDAHYMHSGNQITTSKEGNAEVYTQQEFTVKSNLPAPALLQAYHAVDPEMAKQVFNLAKEDIENRRTNNNKILSHSVIITYILVIGSILSGVGLLGVAIMLMFNDKPWYYVSATFVAAITLFANGSRYVIKDPKK